MAKRHWPAFLDDLNHSLFVLGYGQDGRRRGLLGIRELLPRVGVRAVGV